MEIAPMSQTTGNKLILKNVIRTVNGLPPTNTDYLHEFQQCNVGNVESMVKVITYDEMIYKLEGLDFFAKNTDFDLEMIELVCFSNYTIELLRAAINDNSSPLWNIDCNFKDIKLDNYDCISKLNGSFISNRDTNMECTIENISDLRGLLRDYLDEDTLAFLSEIFPVANGVAFPIYKKSHTDEHKDEGAVTLAAQNDDNNNIFHGDSSHKDQGYYNIALEHIGSKDFLMAQYFDNTTIQDTNNTYTSFNNLFKSITPPTNYTNVFSIDNMLYEYMKLSLNASQISNTQDDAKKSFLDKDDKYSDYLNMSEFDLGEPSMAKRNAIRFLTQMSRSPFHPASSEGWCQLTPFTLMLLYIFNLRCTPDIETSVDMSFSCLSITKKLKTPLCMAIEYDNIEPYTYIKPAKYENVHINTLLNDNNFIEELYDEISDIWTDVNKNMVQSGGALGLSDRKIYTVIITEDIDMIESSLKMRANRGQNSWEVLKDFPSWQGNPLFIGGDIIHRIKIWIQDAKGIKQNYYLSDKASSANCPLILDRPVETVNIGEVYQRSLKMKPNHPKPYKMIFFVSRKKQPDTEDILEVSPWHYVNGWDDTNLQLNEEDKIVKLKGNTYISDGVEVINCNLYRDIKNLKINIKEVTPVENEKILLSIFLRDSNNKYVWELKQKKLPLGVGKQKGTKDFTVLEKFSIINNSKPTNQSLATVDKEEIICNFSVKMDKTQTIKLTSNDIDDTDKLQFEIKKPAEYINKPNKNFILKLYEPNIKVDFKDTVFENDQATQKDDDELMIPVISRKNTEWEKSRKQRRRSNKASCPSIPINKQKSDTDEGVIESISADSVCAIIENISEKIKMIEDNNINPDKTGYYDPELFLNRVLIHLELPKNDYQYIYNSVIKREKSVDDKFTLFHNYKNLIKNQKDEYKKSGGGLLKKENWYNTMLKCLKLGRCDFGIGMGVKSSGGSPQESVSLVGGASQNPFSLVGGDSFFSRYSNCMTNRAMLSVLFSSMLKRLCHTPKYDNVIDDDQEINFKTIKSVGFVIKMLKSQYSQFVFEFFPHSIDFICHQKKLQKLLLSSYNIYMAGDNTSMTDDIINSNISKYINILKQLLPAETLGYTDMFDNTRKESENISRGSQINTLGFNNGSYLKNVLDNKIRRRGGNFIYRKQPIDITNILLFTNSSVFINNKDSIFTQHFIRQKCSDAYRMLTMDDGANTKILTPFDSVTEPPMVANNISISEHPQNTLGDNTGIIQSIPDFNFSGGTISNEKKRFMKKMKVLAKKYQARDKCSWENALKKAGEKLVSL